jgi:hypothetical protein
MNLKILNEKSFTAEIAKPAKTFFDHGDHEITEKILCVLCG